MSIISNTSLYAKEVKLYIWLSIIALSIILFQYFLGIKYSWDSNYYLLFSDGIASSNNFDRMAVYAPLYYWSLGILNFFGLSSVGSILLYWWISYFAILTVLFSLTRNIVISALGLIAILSNPTTLSLYRYAWTELGYSAILVVAIYSLYKILTEEKENNSYQLIFLISISILPVQRYIGGYLSVYLGLIYLFSNRKYILNRLSKLIIATLPLIFVISWNVLLTGHMSGSRQPGSLSLLENFELARKVLFQNFSPEWIILLILILITSIISWKKRKFNPLLLLLFIPIAQLIFQIISSTIYAFDTINPRFFIVLTPAIILLIALTLQDNIKNKKGYIVGLVVVFVVIISLNFSYGNQKQYPFLKKESHDTYTKTKSFLLQIEELSTVGIYTGGHQLLGAQFILTSNIIPSSHCQNYKSVGNFRSGDLSYIPACNNESGHIYVPVVLAKNILLPQYIVVSKGRLPKKWKDIFKDYDYIDLGSFFGLVKKNNDPSPL